MILLKPSVKIEFGPSNDEAVRLLESSGRTCYKSETKSDGTLAGAEAFIRRIIERGHESVLEHVGWTLRFICDRGVTHELVRHRLAAFSQESTRYVDQTDEGHGGHCQFIIPPWVDIEPGTYKNPWIGEVGSAERTWGRAMVNAERAYLALRAQGWSTHQARAVLPNSTKTEIVMTCNAREWRHVIKLRTSSAAHPQMREVMDVAQALLAERCPVLFGGARCCSGVPDEPDDGDADAAVRREGGPMSDRPYDDLACEVRGGLPACEYPDRVGCWDHCGGTSTVSIGPEERCLCHEAVRRDRAAVASLAADIAARDERIARLIEQRESLDQVRYPERFQTVKHKLVRDHIDVTRRT